ncbi:MAG: AmmeMemoRadiSam system protein B [Elusimicrobiota bacterium]
MIRRPAVEGRFYPSDKNELVNFLSSSIKDSFPKSRIILAPHAGYVYSGNTAAKTFSYVEKDFETAVIIGTSHTSYSRKCLILKDTIYSNVLGEVKTDDELAESLLKDKYFENNPDAHRSEHSIEVQIPFLQYIKNDFKILPIVVNFEDEKMLIESGKKIAELMKKKKLVIVISTDLSHYPPYEYAYVSDNAISFAYSASVINRDISYFTLAKKLISEKYKKQIDTIACGFAPMVVGLSAAIESGYNNFDIIECVNSGDISGHRDEVVGYLGGVFLKDGEKEFRFNFDDNEKEYLIMLSRKAIETKLRSKKSFSVDYFQYPKINLPCAIFVTLTINKELRGCIGSLFPHMLVGDAVIDYSIKSAFDDPRFPPLSLEEFKKIKVEISLLSPLKRIYDVSEIKENIHGVYVKNGFMSGTYLPQVWEHFIKKEDFLKSLLDEKSGIGYEKLNSPETEIYIYTVEKINE